MIVVRGDSNFGSTIFASVYVAFSAGAILVGFWLGWVGENVAALTALFAFLVGTGFVACWASILVRTDFASVLSANVIAKFAGTIFVIPIARGFDSGGIGIIAILVCFGVIGFGDLILIFLGLSNLLILITLILCAIDFMCACYFSIYSWSLSAAVIAQFGIGWIAGVMVLIVMSIWAGFPVTSMAIGKLLITSAVFSLFGWVAVLLVCGFLISGVCSVIAAVCFAADIGEC